MALSLPLELPAQLANKSCSPLSNHQLLPNLSFRTHPSIICNTLGNFQHLPQPYQGLHFHHPAHACVSRTTYPVKQPTHSMLTTYSLKGIQRNQGISHPPRACLPITLQIMQSINDLLINQPHSYTNILLWAAWCLVLLDFELLFFKTTVISLIAHYRG